MNPTKLLIAQRLAEHAREGRAIVSLMEPFADDPRWAGVASLADFTRLRVCWTWAGSLRP